MFTDTTYKREFGVIPTYDDVERVNCVDAGRGSHTMCGLYTCCGTPRAYYHRDECANNALTNGSHVPNVWDNIRLAN